VSLVLWKDSGLEAQARRTRSPPTPSTISWRIPGVVVAAIEGLCDGGVPGRSFSGIVGVEQVSSPPDFHDPTL